MDTKDFDDIINQVNPEDEKFVSKNLDISDQVRLFFSRHPAIKNQKQLADKLGKKPSEISKWLSGLHNITLESIIKMEIALGEDIIMTDTRAREKYAPKEHSEKDENQTNKINIDLGGTLTSLSFSKTATVPDALDVAA